MTYTDFYKRRLIRLHPMLIMGTLFGVGYYFLSESDFFPEIKEMTLMKYILAIILCLLNLPTPISLDLRGYREINALIAISWTLQYEYIINILYSLIFRKLHTILIALLTLLSSFLTLNLTLNWDVFDILKGRDFCMYTVID